MSELRELSWAERFAVIDALNPTDEQIIAALDIDATELATARDLRDAGNFADVDIDAEAYADAFDVAIATVEDTSVTEQVVPTTPVTATKPTVEPKKRGRKGTKIAEAFDLIDTTPVAADAFAAQHNVSLNVLRQAKRFDPYADRGRVRVKKIDGTLSIFREAAAE